MSSDNGGGAPRPEETLGESLDGGGGDDRPPICRRWPQHCLPGASSAMSRARPGNGRTRTLGPAPRGLPTINAGARPGRLSPTCQRPRRREPRCRVRRSRTLAHHSGRRCWTCRRRTPTSTRRSPASWPKPGRTRRRPRTHHAPRGLAPRGRRDGQHPRRPGSPGGGRDDRPGNQMTRRSILTLSDLFRRGRERILRGWTQHAPARTAAGTMCGGERPRRRRVVRGGSCLVQRRHGPRLHQRPVLRAVPRGPGGAPANAGPALPGRRPRRAPRSLERRVPPHPGRRRPPVQRDFRPGRGPGRRLNEDQDR